VIPFIGYDSRQISHLQIRQPQFTLTYTQRTDPDRFPTGFLTVDLVEVGRGRVVAVQLTWQINIEFFAQAETIQIGIESIQAHSDLIGAELIDRIADYRCEVGITGRLNSHFHAGTGGMAVTFHQVLAIEEVTSLAKDRAVRAEPAFLQCDQ